MAVVKNMDSTDEQPTKLTTAVTEKEPPPPGTEEDVIETPVQPSTNSSVTNSAIDDEHEEGEIEDDDEGVLEYEDISSEEEVNIRERIAQLEAMDDELRKINQITGACREDMEHFAHGKQSVIDVRRNAEYECISDEEYDELYLRRYEPIPKPKLLPVRRRKLRPLRTAVQRPIRTSSVSRRHGESKRRVEKRKHEQSSAKKSNVYRTRHKRRKQNVGATTVNIIDSSGSEEDFPLDRARLQAACNINAGKRKTDKENWDALKQKLKLSMQKRKQKQSETSKEVELIVDDPMVLVVDEEDEEDEEVLQLRLQALKSKAEIKEAGVISLIEDPIIPEPVAEEQQLRLIALRSAFTKKHEIRQKKKQGERPYSPSDELFLFTSPIEEEDDEVQIIEDHPETVEIADSSSDEENRMEISPEPHFSEPPETTQAVDMELATSGESRSPLPLAASHEQLIEAKDDSPEIEPPPPSIISRDSQSKHPDEDDEESLRNHLLSNLSANAIEPVPASIGTRPMTPDSISEEEADALRELILSKMHKKTSKKHASPVKNALIVSEVSEKTDITDIPNGIQDKSPVTVPCTMEPLTISINNVALPILPEESQLPSPALNLTVSTNQSKVQPHPNLITLIGKQKTTRKKRKKSSSIGPTAAKGALQQVQQRIPSNNQILAIAVPRPSRTLINTQAVQKASLPPPPKVVFTTKKLVNNPNKLINFNAPVEPVLIPSPKERTKLLENYVQKPVSRMVIQVGNSDSDSDPGYYPAPDPIPDPATALETELRLREAFLRDMDNASPSRVMLESPTYSPAPLTPTSVAEMDNTDSLPEAPVVAGTNDIGFEQRLDQFLKTVRSQIDQSKATAVESEKKTRTTVVQTPTAGSGSSGWGTAAKTARKPIMAPAAPITPSAVRHLPKSAQLEYRRLVARMALLEKQKQQRVTVQPHSRIPPPPPSIAQPQALSGPLHTLTKTINNTSPNETSEVIVNHDLVVTVNCERRDVVSKINSNVQQPSKRFSETLVKRVLINNTVIAGRETNHQDVTPSAIITNDVQPIPASTSDTTHKATENTPVKVGSSVTNRKNNASQDLEVTSLREALRRLPLLKQEDRRKVLTIAEHRFEKHSQKFSHELKELIGTVENAQHERQKQYDLENKVAFLKEKLMVLERALSLHKNRLDDIFPALQESHTKVMASRKRSIELNNICLAIGRETQGQIYSPPSSARNEIHEQLKVLTTETKRLKEMKRLSLDEFKQLTAEQRRMQHEKQRHQIEEQLVKSATPEPPIDELPPVNDESQNKTIETTEPLQIAPELGIPPKQYAKSAPTSRSVSPAIASEQDQHGVTQEAPAALACEIKSQFKQYSSPLVSLKDKSALNIPDGVLCPYQMRGECIDQDCKYDHFK